MEDRNTSSSLDYSKAWYFFAYFPQISIMSWNFPFWMLHFHFLVNVLTQMNICFGKTWLPVTTCKNPYADTSFTNLLSCYLFCWGIISVRRNTNIWSLKTQNKGCKSAPFNRELLSLLKNWHYLPPPHVTVQGKNSVCLHWWLMGW